jgi:hypothetical protein
MRALFDMYKVDLRGSAMWMGSVHSYNAAAFEIELSAARSPGDYAIVNRQTGERTVLSFGSQPKSEASAMKKPTD